MKAIAILLAAASLIAAPAVADVTFVGDEFVLRSGVGPDVAPGPGLVFEVTQPRAGASAAWTPELTVVAAGAAGQGIAHAGPAAADDGSWTLGAIEITRPFARATLPNAPVAGGFMSIRNDGVEDDRLVAAASGVAGRMELHEMTMEGDVMRMRELADGLPIPAGATVDLVPGGYHLMFMDLRRPLVEGETVDVTLTFEEAGEISVPLAIGPVNARAGEMDHGDMDHGAMDH